MTTTALRLARLGILTIILAGRETWQPSTMLSSLPRLLGKRVRQGAVEEEEGEEEDQEDQTQIMSSFTTTSRRQEIWTTDWT